MAQPPIRQEAVQYHLGMTAYKLGDRQAARDALTRAVGSPPDFPWKAEARKVLAELKAAPPCAEGCSP